MRKQREEEGGERGERNIKRRRDEQKYSREKRGWNRKKLKS